MGSARAGAAQVDLLRTPWGSRSTGPPSFQGARGTRGASASPPSPGEAPGPEGWPRSPAQS
eukprot:4181184-Alexandrium_andersonii.AAC.1